MPDDPRFDRVIEIDDVTGGVVTSLPRNKRPTSSFYVGNNLRMEGDEEWLGRKEGTSSLGDKVDTSPVLLLMSLIDENGNVNILRITQSSIYLSYGNEDWFEISQSFLSGAAAPFDGTFFLGNVYLVNGRDHVIEVNLKTKTAIELTDSPKACTHIENYGDRIIIAREAEVFWCANSVPSDFSSESAGSEPLVQGAGELSNAITGLHSIADQLVILRRDSIWHASRQPFAEAPFRFDRIINELGCDLPYSSAKFPGGIIYADARSKAVYAYALGSFPQKLSDNVRGDMFGPVAHRRWIRGIYIPARGCYVLGLPGSTSVGWITSLWKYYYKKGAWLHDDVKRVSTVGALHLDDVVFIDDLVGSIKDLDGVIDELSTSPEIRPDNIALGLSYGEVIYYDEDSDTEWDGTSVEGTIQSHDLCALHRESSLKTVGLDVETIRAGSLTVEHGNEDGLWRNSKTVNLTVGLSQVLLKTTLAGKRLFWRLRFGTGDIHLTGWWAKLLDRALK